MTPAPAAPGALGQPPSAAEVLDYLAAMNRWTVEWRAALGDVDERALLGGADGVLTGDVTLAYAVGQSIATRLDELTRAWDSGRVGRAELERIGDLLWSRLDTGSGGLGVSIGEACVLGEALLARLVQRLENDPARTSAALRARDVREALARCRTQAAELGRTDAVERADAVEADLERALAGPGQAARDTVAEADAAASALERELILAAAARSSRIRVRASLDARLRAAVARAADVRRLAARCTEEIAGAPALGVPSPARLGGVPDDDSIDAYAARLDRVEAALREAAERYAAPLAELAELSGLLDAYRAKAGATGRAAGLAQAYAEARAVLDARPCDLAEARERVRSYRRGVDTGEDARKRTAAHGEGRQP
jgi:hypothetical protein